MLFNLVSPKLGRDCVQLGPASLGRWPWVNINYYQNWVGEHPNKDYYIHCWDVHQGYRVLTHGQVYMVDWLSGSIISLSSRMHLLMERFQTQRRVFFHEPQQATAALAGHNDRQKGGKAGKIEKDSCEQINLSLSCRNGLKLRTIAATIHGICRPATERKRK